MRRTCTIVVVLTLFVAVSTPGTRARSDGDDSVRASELEVALVERIVGFVTWPESSGLDRPDAPFEVVVLGSGEDFALMRAAYPRARLLGHETRVRRADGLEGVGHPHVLFVEPDWAGRVDDILSLLGTSPTLIVGHSPCLASRGVAVNLVREGPYVRFEVNRSALTRSDLRASYHMLRVALTPRDECRP